MTYRHTPDMGEISGFGGGYEKCCQDMLEAGVLWLNDHPNADLKGHAFKDVTGIFESTSDDAKALENAVMDAVKGEGATGAMHQVVMERLFWIAGHGWDKYCEELRQHEKEQR